MGDLMSEWLIYQGAGDPHDEIDELPSPPPWRVFDESAEPVPAPTRSTDAEVRKAVAYRPDPMTVERVNAAIFLRRPLLVSGSPGTGKSSLAYSIAHELKLGSVLRWSITSRAVLRDGLYEYDPLARLYAASRRSELSGRHSRYDTGEAGPGEEAEDIGRYIRLGPLGTALLPSLRPRVLLIDEIDKGDLDLPNDLLTVFEEGMFEIRELVRLAETHRTVRVLPFDSETAIPVTKGRIRCRSFPIVVMTSNDEREFPPAFLRRCIRVFLKNPDREKLIEIVTAHLAGAGPSSMELIDQFLGKGSGVLATDQLLNAIYLTDAAERRGDIDRRALADHVMSRLSSSRQSRDDD